jgi:HAD superfamily hydrolase (TIGR01509 family)
MPPQAYAVIFDLDGVLLDSEQRWDEVRESFVRETGGHWRDEATRTMMGMSSPEWSGYLHDVLGVPLGADQINREVVRRVQQSYERQLPLVPGARDAVRSLAAHWKLGLATSSNRELIDLFLELSGLADDFAVSVSSEEVGSGKPAPDVYLAAARRLQVEPRRTVAIEDSSNGIRSAASAEMAVIAIPNAHFPPDRAALELARATVSSLPELTPQLVESAAQGSS